MDVDLFQAEVDAGDDGAEEPACLRRRLLFLLIGERSRPSDQALLLDHAFRIRLHRRGLMNSCKTFGKLLSRR